MICSLEFKTRKHSEAKAESPEQPAQRGRDSWGREVRINDWLFLGSAGEEKNHPSDQNASGDDRSVSCLDRVPPAIISHSGNLRETEGNSSIILPRRLIE